MPRKRRKRRKKSQTQLDGVASQTPSFCNTALNQRDLLIYIISFLRIPSLYSQEQFPFPCYGISHYMRHAMASRGIFDEETYFHAFNSLPVEWRQVNKIFNEIVTELTHVVASIQSKLDFNLLSLSPQCIRLKQLYLIEAIYDQDFENKMNIVNQLRCPNLQILQIHFHHKSKKPLNICLSKENLPSLIYLILGTAHQNEWRPMMMNEVNLDLEIRELRIQYCTIKNLDSLRFSLARCSDIEHLWLMFPSLSDVQKRVMLHALCMLSVTKLFIQSDTMPELSIYAPNLRVIQFYFCDVLDKFILLNRIPNQMRKYMNSTDVNVEETEDGERKLLIGFDNTYEELQERHIPKFKVIKGAKRINNQCRIKWTCLCREMLLWPFDTF